ncbi:hypothetical protein Ccrd_022024 [Cynara cardunculus var. scolymus]|uniref:Target SNARE coiled-coil domain-containing protein n=1 Tax=Cynara cardunculus var. scolymus TaxID=59895 RepID=A0A103XZG7_CYNCS|nr:hypothetical protein Ccrd_022024 [Cynara cardunculus var. scolymus]
MTNEELVQAGLKSMDETDHAIEHSKQTEQMGRIVNDLDAIHFSIKKVSKLVKEIERQVATDKCIMLFIFLIVSGVIAIIIMKIAHPENKYIRDIPGLAPPVPSARRLLYVRSGELFS